MRYPAATWRPGPIGKVWAGRNTCAGVVLHSMEGSFENAMLILDNEEVDARGRYRYPSWFASITKDGRIYEHYELEACTFHDAAGDDNMRFVGIEHEGVAGEPLTEPQLEASVRLAHWICDVCGLVPDRRGVNRTLWEHRERMATECPSGRIPWERYEAPEPQGEEMGMLRPLDQANSILLMNTLGNSAGEWITDSGTPGAYEVQDTFNGSPIPDGVRVFAVVVPKNRIVLA